MVTHIVIFSWRSDVSRQQVRDLAEAMDALANDLHDIVTMSHGPDLAFRDGNGDYALVATFADKASWDAYQAHPRHKAFVRDVVTPIQASRLTIQF